MSTETINKLPSSLQIGETCRLSFSPYGVIDNCKVHSVRFTASKVYYNLLVPIGDDLVLVKDVDSICVEKIQP